MRLSGALLLVCVVIASAGEARADADDPEGARRDFGDGVRLLQLGDFEGARRLFKQADAKHHAVSIVYNLGLAEERLGHVQAAVDAYEAYVSEAGDAGELSATAAVAIAQVKSRSTRLRIGTTPAGARLFVDGAPLIEASPAIWLVSAGHHVIVAQGNGWRAEQDVEARGVGDVVEVTMQPTANAAVPATAAPVPATSGERGETVTPPTHAPDGLVWGAAFALVPFHMFGAVNKDRGNGDGTTQMAAGGIVELGYVIADEVALLVRSLIAFGPDGEPTTLHMSGIGLSVRVARRVWLGASFIGGQLATEARSAPFQTDLVFGALFEATYAVISTRLGQWSVGVQPGFLLATEGYENPAIVLPVTFGFHAY